MYAYLLECNVYKSPRLVMYERDELPILTAASDVKLN